MNGKLQVIVATNAFGMGINKLNVRFIIHYEFPKSIENYVQECGWAGWDKLPADCYLLYSDEELKMHQFMQSKQHEKHPHAYEKNMKDVYAMLCFCHNDIVCMRDKILSYFEEEKAICN